MLALVVSGCAGPRQPETVERVEAERDDEQPTDAADEVTVQTEVTTVAGATGADSPPFYGTSSRLTEAQKERMRGSSWRRGCPVPLYRLRMLRLSFWGFDGEVHRGVMVVHEDEARPVISAFRRIYAKRFKIRQMRLIDAFDGSDDRSMAANNTSAFNCRYVKGTTRWSEHSYGKAIDINPIQNPYVKGGVVDPPAGARYVDRSNVRKGMIIRGWAVTDAFDAIGWGWGGRWRHSKDYQHFSRSGS